MVAPHMIARSAVAAMRPRTRPLALRGVLFMPMSAHAHTRAFYVHEYGPYLTTVSSARGVVCCDFFNPYISFVLWELPVSTRSTGVRFERTYPFLWHKDLH